MAVVSGSGRSKSRPSRGKSASRPSREKKTERSSSSSTGSSSSSQLSGRTGRGGGARGGRVRPVSDEPSIQPSGGRPDRDERDRDRDRDRTRDLTGRGRPDRGRDDRGRDDRDDRDDRSSQLGGRRPTTRPEDIRRPPGASSPAELSAIMGGVTPMTPPPPSTVPGRPDLQPGQRPEDVTAARDLTQVFGGPAGPPVPSEPLTEEEEAQAAGFGTITATGQPAPLPQPPYPGGGLGRPSAVTPGVHPFNAPGQAIQGLRNVFGIQQPVANDPFANVMGMPGNVYTPPVATGAPVLPTGAQPMVAPPAPVNRLGDTITLPGGPQVGFGIQPGPAQLGGQARQPIPQYMQDIMGPRGESVAPATMTEPVVPPGMQEFPVTTPAPAPAMGGGMDVNFATREGTEDFWSAAGVDPEAGNYAVDSFTEVYGRPPESEAEIDYALELFGGGGGFEGGGGGGDNWGPFGSYDDWANQFEQEHGRPPTSQDEDDAIASFYFLDDYGRAPTQDEWVNRYWTGDWFGGGGGGGGWGGGGYGGYGGYGGGGVSYSPYGSGRGI